MPGAEADSGLISASFDAALDAGRWPEVAERLAQEFNGASPRLSLNHLPTIRGPTASGADREHAQKRRRRPLTQTQLERLSLLTPHVRRALQLNRSMDELRFAYELACEALHQLRHGVLVVEADARVLLANRAAQAMLADPRGVLRLQGQRLHPRRHTDDMTLVRLIGAAAQDGTGGSCVISRESRPAVVILVVPGMVVADSFVRRAHAVVLVKDLDRLARWLPSSFGRQFALTRAQMALATEIVQGDGVRAAARRLRISYGTARAHLLQIFQKTGVRRQTELIRLMSSWDDGVGQLADAWPAR